MGERRHSPASEGSGCRHEDWNAAFRFCMDCGVSEEQIRNPAAPDYDPRRGMELLDMADAMLARGAERRAG